MKKLSLTLFVLVSVTACFRHTIHVGTGAPQGTNGVAKYDRMQNFFLLGLVGDPETDVQNICKSNNASIDIRQTFADGLLRGLTFGIYTPDNVAVYCGEPSKN